MKNQQDSKKQLGKSWREVETDKRFPASLEKAMLRNISFERAVALKGTFKDCDFSYCFFSDAYFRGCRFQNCNFTGVRFIRCNLESSEFDGCNFDYAEFDKTNIDNHILDRCCPGRENLKLKFARSLRINYQGLGDAKSANKAMNIELSATEEHLHKAWQSNESYYRAKYQGLQRVQKLIEWSEFKILDFVWGNGEKLSRLLRFAFLCVAALAFYGMASNCDGITVDSYSKAFVEAWLVFISFAEPDHIGTLGLSIIYSVRLIWFALLISILVKRLNRR